MRPGVIGEIALFGGDFAPINWLFCDGQPLPVHGQENLFQAIGAPVNADGQTFTIPKVAGPAPGVRTMICTAGVYPFDGSDIGISYTMGEIRLFATTATPTNWLPCDGRSLATAQHTLLNMVLTARFGGDAQGFRLPNLMAPAAGVRYLLGTAGAYPDYTANSSFAVSNQGVGEIRLWPGVMMPGGCVPCDGRVVSGRSDDYAAVVAVLGNRFGGDFRADTFQLPILTGPVAGTQYIICTSGVFPARA